MPLIQVVGWDPCLSSRRRELLTTNRPHRISCRRSFSFSEQQTAQPPTQQLFVRQGQTAPPVTELQRRVTDSPLPQKVSRQIRKNKINERQTIAVISFNLDLRGLRASRSDIIGTSTRRTMLTRRVAAAASYVYSVSLSFSALPFYFSRNKAS